jgi:hypothetical protein
MSIASKNEGRTAMTATPIKHRRELAHRASNGIDVFLFWDARSNDLSIEVVDVREETAFGLRVDAKSALDAFYHPYAYRGVLGIDLEQEPALATSVERTTTRREASR